MSRANRTGTEPGANTTDPDVRVMRDQKSYVAGYNGQLVAARGQVIVGAMLCRHPVDRALLHHCWTPPPAADPGRHTAEAAYRAGRPRYVSEENIARADADGLRLLAPLAKDPDRHRARTPQRTLHLDRLPPTPAPGGGCCIRAAATTARCGPAPWNKYSGNSRPARSSP